MDLSELQALRIQELAELAKSLKISDDISGLNNSGLDIVQIEAEITNPGSMQGYKDSQYYDKVYKMLITGASSGSAWGTDIYTDDSTITYAAVHAGAIAVGVTDYVYVKVLPGQSNYISSTQNGITSSSWGSWNGSYTFVINGVGESDSTSNHIF